MTTIRKNNITRTYALYKRIILCINEDTLFQALINHPWMDSVGVARRRHRLKSLEKSKSNACNPYPIFGFSCQCVSPNNKDDDDKKAQSNKDDDDKKEQYNKDDDDRNDKDD